MSTKAHAIHALRKSASSARAELVAKGMPRTARAISVLSKTTAAIGSKVEGWSSTLGIRAAPLSGHKRAKSPGLKKAARVGKKRKRSGSRKRRSPAQMKAFRKMIAARKKSLKGGHRRRARRKSR